MKGQAALCLVATRMHPCLHRALAYRDTVEKLREVANRIVHLGYLLACQRRLDGVINVKFVDDAVDRSALHLNIAKSGYDVLAENVVNAAEAKQGVETAGHSMQQFSAVFTAFPLNRFKCTSHAVDCESHRVRKLGIQQEKFEDLIRSQVSR